MANETSPELTAVLSLLLGDPSPDAVPYRPEGEICFDRTNCKFSPHHLLKRPSLSTSTFAIHATVFLCKEVPSQSHGQLVYGYPFCVLILCQ